MPAVSLVVCVFNERDLLKRLLREAEGCCDDLVVVHDGPDTHDVRSVVEAGGGRFIENARRGSLEGQSPFAWAQAKHDWILRLDADEIPSVEMKSWLRQFREAPEPLADISGYTCIWPLWNGKKAVTRNWPDGRLFLLHKQRVRFIGIVEASPVSDRRFEPLKLVLRHEPNRKSYGVRNILIRRQAYHWREVISQNLMGPPTALPCWRWNSADWPASWEYLRRHPVRHSLRSLFWYPLCQLKDMLRAGEMPRLSACLNPGLHHFMLGLRVQSEIRRRRRQQP
jgi:glycosyltransferase involved in cell wall biosynthesis